jgi:hypothetical protein
MEPKATHVTVLVGFLQERNISLSSRTLVTAHEISVSDQTIGVTAWCNYLIHIGGVVQTFEIV